MLGDEAREEVVVPEPAPEARRADHLLRAVRLVGHGESPLTAGLLERLVPGATARVGGRSVSPEELDARRRSGAVEGGEAPAGEELTREVEWTALRLAAANGDDRRARSERVQPLGGGRHARPDHLHAVGVLVWLVGVHGARVAHELGRDREPRMTGRQEDVAEDVPLVQLEPALDGAHIPDAGCAEAVVPTGGCAQLLDVAEELRHGRVVPVEGRLDERNDAPPPARRPEGEPGEARGGAVPVAFRAHAALADRRCPNPPCGRRVRVRSEHGYFGRGEPSFPKRRIRDEAGEASTDDCALLRHDLVAT